MAVLAIKREEAISAALAPLEAEINTITVISAAPHPPTTFSNAVTATRLEDAISEGVKTY